MKIPRATYRLQLHRDFGFSDVTALIPYLAELGVSHVYLSPWLKARPGSTHGYDIVDHAQLNPELGSDDDFVALAAALAAHGLGQVADIVPNHMGIMGSDNAWWLDVLENGRASKYAGYFDIDWTPPLRELSGKVLVPVLADNYGEVLLRGEFQLEFDRTSGEFSVHYFRHRFPLDPRSYAQVLSAAARHRMNLSDQAAHRLDALSRAFAALPKHDGARGVARRSRDKDRLKRELAALVAAAPQTAERIAEAVTYLNGRPADAASFDALHALLEAQAFRLASWRVAADDINYRRFFDVNELAALRVEDPQVFAESHRLVLRLVAEGKVSALRIDHLDGLYDPKAYLENLQAAVRSALTPTAARRARSARAAPANAVYIVVEKILAQHEALPAEWPTQGTTGYRFANLVGGLWINAAATSRFDRLYSAFIGRRIDFGRILDEAKLLTMTGALASDLNLLTHALTRIAEADRNTRDLTFNGLRRTLMLYTVALPVYRTYVDDRGPSAADLRHVDWAIGIARQRRPAPDPIAFEFLRQVLAGSLHAATPLLRAEVNRFARRLQQFTGPVMAKAMEDTGFYSYNRLVALNEVGGDPRQFGVSVAAFHAAAQERQRTWPGEMLATSTLCASGFRRTCARPCARRRCIAAGPAPTKPMKRRWPRSSTAWWGASSPTDSCRRSSRCTRWSRAAACTTASRKPCSSSPRRASLTSIKATSCGISVWSIRTTGERSTTESVARCWTRCGTRSDPTGRTPNRRGQCSIRSMTAGSSSMSSGEAFRCARAGPGCSSEAGMSRYRWSARMRPMSARSRASTRPAPR